MDEQKQSTTPIAPEADKKTGWRRHTTKRNLLIILMLLGLCLLAGLLVWRNRRMNYAKQFTVEGWHAIAKSSDEIAGVTKSDPNLDKSNELATALRQLDGTLKDQSVSLILIPQFLNDQRALNAYGDFVGVMSDYSKQVAGMSDDASAITNEDLTTAKELATKAAASVTATKKSLSYLSENINAKLFEVPTYLESLKKLSDEAKAKALADAKSKKEAAEQDALNEQLVGLSITGFMDGFVAGDATKMKRYMTAAFVKEYNFDQLSNEQRQYVYPVSYRVITTTKKSATTYDVQVNILNKYRNSVEGAPDQYTQTMTYSLVYVDTSARWLVNFEKAN